MICNLNRRIVNEQEHLKMLNIFIFVQLWKMARICKRNVEKNAECKTNLSFDNICKSSVIIEILGKR